MAFRRVKAGQTPGFPRFKAAKRFSGFAYPDPAGWKLMEHGGSGATLRLGSGKDAMSIRARGRHRFGPSARPNDITLTRKNGAWFYAMLRTGTHYQDKSVDYEALSVARNAPRWIKMLKKHGFMDQPATT